MNQKTLAALTIIAIIFGVLNLTLLLFLNSQISKIQGNETSLNIAQDIPLQSINIELQRVSGENINLYYRAKIRAGIPDERLTLFNVVLKMEYLTESNTWKTNSEYLGIVNFHSTDSVNTHVTIVANFNIDNDFKNDDENLKASQAFFNGYQEMYKGNNIRAEAYGYPRP